MPGRRPLPVEDAGGLIFGEVVKLDRGFPLVRTADGSLVRCEHAVDLVKTGESRAVIGDAVLVDWPRGHDKGIIARILPRRTSLVRKDPAERALPQVLAANFDLVIVAQPISEVNLKRMERELVLAFETGARVAVVLTKADLAEGEGAVGAVRAKVNALAGADVPVIVMSNDAPQGLNAVRALIGADETAVLIGKSGVGKSSLVNLLVGDDVQETGDVRASDGKGRHTTVSREIVDLPGGGRVVDMPGVRGLGLWDADAGIEAAFADVESFAANCRFRDCRHIDEPGCAVRAAVGAGRLAPERLSSYLALKEETRTMRERREQAQWRQRDVGLAARARNRAHGAKGKGKAKGGKGKAPKRKKP